MTVEVYRNRYCLLKAMQFTGTQASGVALAAAFPGYVAGDLERPDGILVLATRSFDGARPLLRALKIGEWLVADHAFDGMPMALSDSHFRVLYRPHRET